MKYRLAYLSEDQLVCATISGPITLADYERLLADIRIEMARRGISRLLIDLQRIQSRVNLLDVHDMPDVNKAMPAQAARKTAIVHMSTPAAELDHLHYFCHRINAEGFEARLFTHYQQAVAWLKD